MAVAHQVPTCPYCSKPIATACHKDESAIPVHNRVIGDTFVRWEYEKHDCKEGKKARLESDKAWEKYRVEKYGEKPLLEVIKEHRIKFKNLGLLTKRDVVQGKRVKGVGERNTEKKLTLYSLVENEIVKWSNNGTETAGSLTRRLFRKFNIKEKK